MVSQSVRTMRVLSATTDTAGEEIGDGGPRAAQTRLGLQETQVLRGGGLGFMSIREERQEVQKFNVILNCMANLKPA